MTWVAASLVLTTLPLIEGREQGWPAWTWVSMAAGIAGLAGFVPVERAVKRRGGKPLVNMALFNESAFRVGLAVQLIFWMGQAAFFLVLALFIQRGQGMSALQAGLLFLPLGAGYLITSLTARHVAARVGRQAIALGALTMLTAEICVAVMLSVHTTAWLWLLLALDGAGMGLTVGPLAATILAKITPSHAGAASGVLATAQQIGNALGVAFIGVIFYSANPRTRTETGSATASST
jgi:predicted MFS family arabinose efflux permease